MINKSVSIVDYGIGNIHSVQHAFQHVGAKVSLIQHPEEVEKASRLILPGVGAFADGMQELKNRNLVEALESYVKSGKSLLGICLGMQMLGTSSEEFGVHMGLNFVPGTISKIPSVGLDGACVKLPSIGWAELTSTAIRDWQNSFLRDTNYGSAVYLVHSYMFNLKNSQNLLAEYNYGGHQITAAICHENIMGCQFHPEKSGRIGLNILDTFIENY